MSLLRGSQSHSKLWNASTKRGVRFCFLGQIPSLVYNIFPSTSRFCMSKPKSRWCGNIWTIRPWFESLETPLKRVSSVRYIIVIHNRSDHRIHRPGRIKFNRKISISIALLSIFFLTKERWPPSSYSRAQLGKTAIIRGNTAKNRN